MKPVLLDLFCGAGGCSVGYHRAGFEVIGVDIRPQPNYPYEFHQADALEFPIPDNVAVIHASPPCHAYSTATTRNAKNRRTYPDLLPQTRELLEAFGRPWVMENVVGAPMLGEAPLFGGFILCGSSFGLDLRRHRQFESNVGITGLPCDHAWQTPRFRSLDSRRNGRLSSVVGVHGHLNYPGEKELREKAMGIDWMSTYELTQAIPPAYTEHIGLQLIRALQSSSA